MIDWISHIERQLHAQNNHDTHTERDTNTFHPSALSRCERSCAISKLGLETHGVNTLMNFYLGNRQHKDIRYWFKDTFPRVEFEKELSLEIDHDIPDKPGVTILRFTGHCDVYDEIENVIYEFKTRKSWNGFDGASDSHKDQLTTYMKMAGVTKGQLVYIVKSAPWDENEPVVRTWPENEYYEFDPDRWNEIKKRAMRIHDGLRAFEEEHDRLPESRDELPFEPCGCWLCNSEADIE